jgi:hypothetical protein
LVSSDVPLNEGCSQISSYGANIAQAIAGARKILAASDREDTSKVIVLFATRKTNVKCDWESDTFCYTNVLCSPGAENYDECIAIAEEDAEQQIQFATADGITVFTIGVGQYVPMDLMQRLAEPTGGTWHHVPDNSQLSATFQNVNEDMQQVIRLTR